MTPSAGASDPAPRFVVGTMTGTSIDGDLDAAVVSIHGHGLEMRAPLVLGRSFPLGTVADDLRRIAAQGAMNAREFASIAHAFGECHAHAVESLCDEAGVKPDLAVLHGQTVFHAPPLSWQLVDPWPVAARLGCAVRYDLRGANIASGGQGAPITPLADFILFADEAMPKTILNLGGFANATLLPPRASGTDGIRGFDACACNHLLDRVARTRLGRPFDEDGRRAAHGGGDLHQLRGPWRPSFRRCPRRTGRGAAGLGRCATGGVFRGWRGGASPPVWLHRGVDGIHAMNLDGLQTSDWCKKDK